MATASVVVKECESSIVIEMSRLLFDKILAKRGYVNKCSVIYYPNDVRVSGDGEIQRKHVKSKYNVLKIVTLPRTTLFLPLTRKMALEYPDRLPQNVYRVKLMIVRYVLHTERHTNYTVRVCVEKHACARAGGKYVFTAEVEYSESSFKIYRRLHAIEGEFLNTLTALYGEELCEIDFERVYSAISPGDIINVPSRVWSRFSDEKAYSQQDVEAVTFKFDGYKGRLVNNGDNNTLFYDDLHNMNVVNCAWFHAFPRLVFQVEIMSTKALILTDVLGAYVGTVDRRNLYMPEPLDVLQFFSTVAASASAQMVDLAALGVYKLRAQESLTKGCDSWKAIAATAKTTEPYDGYILTIGNRIFKYKVPTLDVRCVDRCLHLDDTVNAICPQRYDDLEENAIYEIAPYRKNDECWFKVLRKRVDREYTSTVNEYRQFETEHKFIRKFKP